MSRAGKASMLFRPSFFGPANLVTLLRLPLAGLIWRRPDDRRYVIGILAAAGLTDILDGQIARRIPGAAHPSGAWLDPLCDKIFVLSALGAISYARKPPGRTPVLIGLREIIAAPLLAIFAVRAHRYLHSPRQAYRSINWGAAAVGKAATLLQFSAMGAMLFRHRWMKRLAIAAGLAGPAANLYYFKRAMGDLKRAEQVPSAFKNAA